MTYLLSILVASLAVTSTLAAALDGSTLQARGLGCGQAHNKGIGKVKYFSIMSGGVSRDFAVYLPSGYNQNSATPMILSFHGHGKDMDYQSTLSRFKEPGVNPNMIAVFPQGLIPSGSTERCWEGAPYCTTGVSDKVFVTDLLTYMRNNYCVDDHKIYVSGKSIGGGLVDLLACSPGHGGDFAAFAMDAAALYTEADGSGSICNPARRPMPILELHGTDDTTAKYDGDKAKGLPPIRDVLSKWATRNSCTGSPPAVTIDQDQGNGVHYTQYDCAGKSSVVVGFKVDHQGHWWISTSSNGDNKGKRAPIDASTKMMAFFNANTKP
ncbi:hypothetical protein H2200_009766 [Cladophialophora chaetospira]|uniref:feruloyl esterase n=1 Tax=Cladophialophora chaetospira TaxID=386627 RepID=A0AA39CF66_9EURO|nr:hypothetical protein H2200_009766 [Cladophialophora chaetospira]